MPIGVVILLAACGSEEPELCETGVDPDGALTVAAGEICLRDVAVRARSNGEWGPAGVEVGGRSDGAVLTLVAEQPVEAFELRVEGLAADRMLQQGFQSWSFSGAVRIPPSVTLHDDGAPLFAAALSGDTFDEEIGVSYESTVLGGETGPYLVVGTVGAEQAYTGIAATRGAEEGTADVSIVFGVARERIPASDGTTVRSDPIAVFGAPTAQAGLARYGEELAAAFSAFEPQQPPGGWFSWNERFEEIDQQFIRDHIAIVRDELAPLGLPLVEIDDGWEIAWGDWIENPEFADGMGTLAAEIDAEGLVAGIWMAPFLVDRESDIAATLDPSIFVQDANGNPLVHDYNGASSSYYVIDATDPDGIAFMTAAVERLADAGYRFFKFDFLYAGSIPGVRDSAVTGYQALRTGLRALRAAAGDGAIINACGVPMPAALGIADSLRIGPDTAFPLSTLSLPMVSSPARSYAARAHLRSVIWPDADQTQVRADYGDALARVSAAVAALPGPAYALGDDLTALPADRLDVATAADILDIAASLTPALPVDLMDAPASDIVASPLIESYRTPTFTDMPPPSRWEAQGASGDHYEVTFDWNEPQSVTIDVVQP